jgi:hypothetical protein
VREQQGAAAHARSRQRGFGAGMATTYHDDIEIRWILHEWQCARQARIPAIARDAQ